MRALRSLSTVIGLAILGILVALVGKDETLAATARALGWQSLLVCLPFALIMAVDTLVWRYAFAYDRVPFLRLMAARVAGEAVNVMTAVAPVGGDAIKVWFLGPHVPYRESVASVIIAKTTIHALPDAVLAPRRGGQQPEHRRDEPRVHGQRQRDSSSWSAPGDSCSSR